MFYKQLWLCQYIFPSYLFLWSRFHNAYCSILEILGSFLCHPCAITPVHWTFISDVLILNFGIQNWSFYHVPYLGAIYHLLSHYAIFLMLLSIFIIGSSKCFLIILTSVWTVYLILLPDYFPFNYGLYFNALSHVYSFDFMKNLIYTIEFLLLVLVLWITLLLFK